MSQSGSKRKTSSSPSSSRQTTPSSKKHKTAAPPSSLSPSRTTSSSSLPTSPTEKLRTKMETVDITEERKEETIFKGLIVEKLGVMDSGIGGFSFVRQLQRQGITVPVVYVSDAKYMPYGDLTKEEMKDRVTKLVDFCFERGCDAVVLACNSASSALPVTKYAEDPRVVGVIEPTIRHLKLKQAHDVHVIATVSTIALGLHERGLPSIVASVCPSKELATIVERGSGPTSADAKKALAECLASATDRTQLLLACTHYEILPREPLYQQMPLLQKIWLPCEATLEEVRKEWSFAEGDGAIEVFCSNPSPDQHTRILELFGVTVPPLKDIAIP